jgi:Tol biopolymer transport system component
MAQPFDAGSAQIAGDAFSVAEDVVFSNVTSDFAPITVSDTGVLLYSSRGVLRDPSQIVWLDRAGKLLAPVAGPGNLIDPSISPDEETMAFARNPVNNDNARYDIWLRDLTRGTETRLTFDGSANHPVWSPKGDRIAFSFVRRGRRDIYQKAASGAGESELLVPASINAVPYQWSRDGRFIVYRDVGPKTEQDLWVFPIGGNAPADQKPVPFLQTDFIEEQGQISPDGRWMSYRSDESGQPDVYVRPFPSGEGKWRISTAGGEQPRWRGDGKELFFLGGDGKMMAVPVNPGPSSPFEASSPTPLFQAHIATGAGGTLQYDVTADGKRFLVNTELADTSSATAPGPALNVVVNWQAGLKK